MERLKSSFKSLQGAITNVKAASPTCIQEPQTHSFTEAAGHLYSSFCHLYCDHDSAGSPSSSGQAPPPPFDIHLPCIGDDDGGDNICCDAATISTSAASSSSSSSRTIGAPNEVQYPDSFAPGLISPKRFFFSPRTTNSIMEEAKREAAGGGGGDKRGSEMASFREGSTTVTMASRDPYCDFRASMEEMVVAHELRDWRSLQELLHCYLSLNEKKQHKVIVLAFVDLLMQLMSRDKEEDLSSPSPFLHRPELELPINEK